MSATASTPAPASAVGGTRSVPALLERWVESVGDADRAARFERLLYEQLTPLAVGAVTAPG